MQTIKYFANIHMHLFNKSADHNSFRDAVQKFVGTEIVPFVDEWERCEKFPQRELFKKAGAAGILGIMRDPELGGLGLDYSFNSIYIEEFGRCRSSSVATAIGVQTDMCTPALAKYGSSELQKEFLIPAIKGDLIGCIGVSESGAGSDVASIKTTGIKEGGDYVINGGKMWITNGDIADWGCILVNTQRERSPHHNKSLIVVPLNSKGVTRSKPLNKHGLRASGTAQIFFDDVRVPQRFCIGEENKGFIYQMEQFQEERLFSAIRTTSQLERAIEITLEYTKSRHAFGRSILSNQWVHFILSELATEVALLRALWEKTVAAYIAGDDIVLMASMAKLKAGQLARKIPDQCLQFFGGQGFMQEAEISRLARDLRLVAIGGGATEVMLGIISKQLMMRT